TCTPQRNDSAAHLCRPRLRGVTRGGGGHGDGIRLAWRGPARHRVNRLPRLPGDPDHLLALRRHVHRREPDRRPALRLGRSAHPAGGSQRPPEMSAHAPDPTAAPALRAVDAAALPETPQLRAATRAMPQVVELFRRNKILIAPLLVLVAFVFVGLFAPYLSPLPPTQTELGLKLTPPVWLEGGVADRPLGTDQLGRDIGSRLIHGARLSLTTALIGIVLSGIVGTSLGLLAGYYGAWIDALIMRAADITLAIHLYILAIVLAVVWGPGLRNVLLVTVFLLWSRYARQARAEVLSLREREFVVAARALGVSAGRIMARHLLPNLLASLIVLSTLQVGFVIVLEA